MALTHFRSLLSAYGRNYWPRYRGRRAGILLRAKEITQCYKISQVQSRQVNHVKTQTDFRGHNPANCIFIATNQCRAKGLDIILPLKSKTVYPNEPPWINPTLKKLITKRQRALNLGDHAESLNSFEIVSTVNARCAAPNATNAESITSKSAPRLCGGWK